MTCCIAIALIAGKRVFRWRANKSLVIGIAALEISMTVLFISVHSDHITELMNKIVAMCQLYTDRKPADYPQTICRGPLL